MFKLLSQRQSLKIILSPIVLALVIGSLAGLGAVAFKYLLEVGVNLLWAGDGVFCHRFAAAPWYLKLAIPCLAGLVVGPVITWLAPELRGPGVPEVMEAMALSEGRIRGRVVLLKTAVTALMISAGGSLGREGPIVQIGSSIGSSITSLLRMSTEQRRLAVACGAAAGIAATFQAPMAGTLFVVEILLFDLEVVNLSNIVIAAVTGTLISRPFLHGTSIFVIPEFNLNHSAELGLYLGLGLMAGFLSLLLMLAVFSLPRVYERLRVPAWLTPACGGLLVGCVGLVMPRALGVGYATINDALAGNLPLSLVLLVLFWKLVATGFSLGSGMSGGIFAPSLVLGAMLGGCVGYLAQAIWPEHTIFPAHYALIGMGAVVSGTTLAPITAILTIFELTYSYQVILPLMVACIASLLVVRFFHGYSIYETKLHLRGVHIVRGHDVNLLRSMWVVDYMDREFQEIDESMEVSEVIAQVERSLFPHFLVLDKERLLAGILTLRDLKGIMVHPERLQSDMCAADFMSREPVTVSEHDDMERVFHLFAKHPYTLMPVVRANNPRKVVGVIREAQLVTAYGEHVLKQDLHS
ncbi:MAG: chloride channel protein [Proteobacteria bacterium]|nr:chloride channel protein [Pseudomonadota bacterium]MBU1420073.1 chloride channel protein [Pseudomonadota bacterium]MBU1454564.1 chloride channel protein [Pseudomonadota bacterium]